MSILDSNLTIVSAADKAHLHKLETCLPTWVHVKGHTGPIVLFIHGWNRRSLKKSPAFDGLRKFKNVRLVKWNPQGIETGRERMLSSFIYGVAREVETEWHCKLDSVTYASAPGPWYEDNWFTDYDLVAQKWGYTKPGQMIEKIDHWMHWLWRAGKVPQPPECPLNEKEIKALEKEIKGIDKRRKRIKKFTPERQAMWDERQRLAMRIDPYAQWKTEDKKFKKRWYVDKEYILTGNPAKPKHGAARICSWIKLMRTSVVQNLAECMPVRMIVPSEDTLCWRWCERLGLRIRRENFKSKGWNHSKRGYEVACADALKNTK